MNSNSVIYHHGIKGQRWGVRRYQNSDGSLTAAGRLRYGDDNSHYSSNTEEASNGRSRSSSTKTNYSVKYRPANELSNSELDAAIERIKKEKLYNETVASLKANSKQQSKTDKFLSDMGNIAYSSLKKAAEQTMTDVGKDVMKYAVGTAINKKFGSEIVNMNKNKNKNKNKDKG